MGAVEMTSSAPDTAPATSPAAAAGDSPSAAAVGPRAAAEPSAAVAAVDDDPPAPESHEPEAAAARPASIPAAPAGSEAPPALKTSAPTAAMPGAEDASTSPTTTAAPGAEDIPSDAAAPTAGPMDATPGPGRPDAPGAADAAQTSPAPPPPPPPASAPTPTPSGTAAPESTTPPAATLAPAPTALAPSPAPTPPAPAVPSSPAPAPPPASTPLRPSLSVATRSPLSRASTPPVSSPAPASLRAAPELAEFDPFAGGGGARAVSTPTLTEAPGARPKARSRRSWGAAAAAGTGTAAGTTTPGTSTPGTSTPTTPAGTPGAPGPSRRAPARAASVDAHSVSMPSPGAAAGPSAPPIAEELPASTEPVFNYSGFLKDLRTKPAEPVARYLRSFLTNFAKKPFTVNEQIKLIRDFLAFITDKMRAVEPWRSQSVAEFDLAVEAMEKVVMNRLYPYTFTPQLTNGQTITTDDLERDAVFTQRVHLFAWVQPKHLDVPENENTPGFLGYAGRELLKINHYKAPRDKLICILNCCKVIFGFIRQSSATADTGADAFLPILIYVVLRAGPPNMLSNVEYINRFRNPEKLQGEAGYYLSSLQGAIAFIETMDASSLSNITQDEFETNVEKAIQELPVSPSSPRAHSHPQPLTAPGGSAGAGALPSAADMSPFATTPGEEAASQLALPTTPAMLDGTKRFFQRTGDAAKEAVSRPLSAINKILENMQPRDDSDSDSESDSGRPHAHSHSHAHAHGQGGVSARYHGNPSRDGTPTRDARDAHDGYPGLPAAQAQAQAQGQWPPGQHPAHHDPRLGAYVHTPQHHVHPAYAHAYTQVGPPPPSAGTGSATQPIPVPIPIPQHVHDPPSRMLAQLGISPDSRVGSESTTPREPTPDYIAHMQHSIDASNEAFAREQARGANVLTLHQMFPALDVEIVDAVLLACGDDLGVAIDRLLEM